MNKLTCIIILSKNESKLIDRVIQKEKTRAPLTAVKPAKFVNPNFTEQEVWELRKSEWLSRAK